MVADENVVPAGITTITVDKMPPLIIIVVMQIKNVVMLEHPV